MSKTAKEYFKPGNLYRLKERNSLLRLGGLNYNLDTDDLVDYPAGSIFLFLKYEQRGASYIHHFFLFLDKDGHKVWDETIASQDFCNEFEEVVT